MRSLRSPLNAMTPRTEALFARGESPIINPELAHVNVSKHINPFVLDFDNTNTTQQRKLTFAQNIFGGVGTDPPTPTLQPTLNPQLRTNRHGSDIFRNSESPVKSPSFRPSKPKEEKKEEEDKSSSSPK